MLGAEIRYLVDDDANRSLELEMEKWASELRVSGKNPCLLPIGGNTALGALGYVQAMRELAGQLKENRVQIVVGVGSCGTLAGMLHGAALYLPAARIIGISLSRSCMEIRERSMELLREIADLTGFDASSSLKIECYDSYHQTYGVPTLAGEEAIRLAAGKEGLLLDPIYTAKVMAGLIDLRWKNIIERNIPVVFMHTGGFPIIFATETRLAEKQKLTKIYRQQ